MLENIRLHLTEDRSSCVTSPGPVPLEVNVTQLRVHRAEDGVLHVEPPPPPAPPGTPAHLTEHAHTVDLLRRENDDLRRRLNALEKINEENHVLRRCQEETQLLRYAVRRVVVGVGKLPSKILKVLKIRREFSKIGNFQQIG